MTMIRRPWADLTDPDRRPYPLRTPNGVIVARFRTSEARAEAVRALASMPGMHTADTGRRPTTAEVRAHLAAILDADQ